VNPRSDGSRSQPTPVNAALIGCGRIGFLLEKDPLRNKPCTHFGGAMKAGIRITLACDIDRAKLSQFGSAAGVAPCMLYGDYRLLLRECRPELVIVATWTESHAKIAALAARSGAKVIVCEKPVSPSLKSARALIRECEKSNTHLIINHERRYDYRYRAAKRIIDAGAIGGVKTVHASILTGGYRGKSDPSEGGGPLLHDGTHMIDIIRFFFGDIASVDARFERSRGRRSGFEDRCAGWLRTKGGVDVFIEAGGCRRFFLFELDISGTDGRLVIGNGFQRLFTSRTSRLYRGFRDLAERRFPAGRKNSCFTEVYREAKRLLAGDEGPAVSGGDDGYRSLEAIHAMYLSSFRGKRVDLPVNPDIIDVDEIFNLKRNP